MYVRSYSHFDCKGGLQGKKLARGKLERVKLERVKLARVKLARVKLERGKLERGKLERVKLERVKLARGKLQALSSVLTAKSETKPLNTTNNVVIKRDIKSLLQTTACSCNGGLHRFKTLYSR